MNRQRARNASEQTRKLLSLFLTTVVLFSALTAVVTLGSGVAVAATNQQSHFNVTDIGTSGGGKLQVTVQAQTDTRLKNFQFEYIDHSDGSTAGPLQTDNSDVSATYDNGTSFTRGDVLTQSSGNAGKVTFTFDAASGFSYSFSDPIQVNVTAFDKSYSSASAANASAYAENLYTLNANDHEGNSLSNSPIIIYNATTNATQQALFGSSSVLHCKGAYSGGICEDPKTGNGGTLTDGFLTFDAPITAEAMSLTKYNSSGKVDPTAGTNNLNADTPVAPSWIEWASYDPEGSTPTINSLKVVNTETGNVVYRESPSGQGSSLPAFLATNTRYRVELDGPNINTQNRSLVLSTKGMKILRFKLPASNVQTQTVVGQVVNESGSPVSNVVVMAEPKQAPPGFLTTFNTTTTDSNGVFSMELPTSGGGEEGSGQEFSFRLVSAKTSGGVPVYYPTRHANNGNGYKVQSSKTVLPPLTIEQGGRVDINVTNKGGNKLKTQLAISELSRIDTAFPDAERTTVTGTFSRFGFGGNKPSSAAISLMSPTTDSNSNVFYTVWSINTNPSRKVCAEHVSVSQGQATSSKCKLESSGTINISMTEYESVIQQSQSESVSTGSFGFLFSNELYVRDATTGDVEMVLGPRSISKFLLSLGGQGSSPLKVPVKPGTYTVEVRPAQEWVRATTVNSSKQLSVTAGGGADISLKRGAPFAVQPARSRMSVVPSLPRDSDNLLAYRVFDPNTGKPLSDSDVSVSAQILYQNGTAASDPVQMSFNSTQDTWEATSFNPKDLGVGAGTYQLAIKVTHSAGTSTYNSTETQPVQISGLQTGINFDSSIYVPGDTASGKLFAFDGNTGVDVDASNITITFYNENGAKVNQTTNSNSISSGTGTFEAAVPDTPGQYEVVITLKTSDGKQGIAKGWIEVSRIDLDVTTGKREYGVNETVDVTVEAKNATSGAAIQDASVTLQVNGNEKNAATGTDGQATFTLDPKTDSQTGQWDSRGVGLSVTLKQETETGIVEKTARTGFDVSLVAIRAEPTQPSFSTSESVVLDVTLPSDKTINQVTVDEIDGEQVSVPSDNVTNDGSGFYTIDLGPQPAGEHTARVRVSTPNGVETERTSFEVKQFSISSSVGQRQYDTGETISVDVEVTDPESGEPVSDQTVEAFLNTSAQNVATDSATTADDGTATLSFSSDRSGFHSIEVRIGEQTQFLAVQVSGLNVTLEDSNGNAVSEYTAEPGSNGTIYVSATDSQGSAVPDGSKVSAAVFAGGNEYRLTRSPAKTSSGDASVEFRLPSDVPAGQYPLRVTVSHANKAATGSATGTLNVTGSSARSVDVERNVSAVAPGGAVNLTAQLTDGDGSPVSGTDLDFFVTQPGGSPQKIATVTTGSNGAASAVYSVPQSASPGAYAVEAQLNSTQSINDFTGFRVQSITTGISVQGGPFAPGENVTVNVSVTDTAGNAVSATGGSYSLNTGGNEITGTLSLSGSSPYSVNVSLPSSIATGDATLSITASQDADSDSASEIITVRNNSESVNFSVDRPVTAGQSTTVTFDSTVDETGVLKAIAPGASSPAFNASVTLSSSSDTTASMTIDSAGLHRVRLQVPGVGEFIKTVQVESASGEPTLSTGPDLSTTNETFNTSEDIYIRTNQSGLTAKLISGNESYSVALDSTDGGTNYGVLSANRSAGTYLVRLDSADATGLKSTIIEVREE